MTEQSKIPLPPEGKAKSLFERVEDLFGLDAFVAPPVPETVAEPPARALIVSLCPGPSVCLKTATAFV